MFTVNELLKLILDHKLEKDRPSYKFNRLSDFIYYIFLIKTPRLI